MFCSNVVIIEFRGGIGGSSSIGGSDGLTLERYRPSIDQAFSLKPLAVCLVINSPGGSPVQSHLLAEYIRHNGDSTGTPIYAFVEDMACSGGYLLAAAADTIFVSTFSTVGSIGVTTTTFKFSSLLNSIGIEAKTYTSGERKGGAFNHFCETTSEDEEDLNNLLKSMHKEFIKWVYKRREGKLDKSEIDEIFSGAVFTGADAIKMGLADQLYQVKEQSIKEAIGNEDAQIINLAPSGGGMVIKLKDVLARSSFLPPPFLSSLGKQVSSGLITGLSTGYSNITDPASVWHFIAGLVLAPILFLMFLSIILLCGFFILLSMVIIIPLKIIYFIFIYPVIWLYNNYCGGYEADREQEEYRRRQKYKKKEYRTVMIV